MQLQTSFSLVSALGGVPDGWDSWKANLPDVEGPDSPVAISRLLACTEPNGPEGAFGDALFALRAVLPGQERDAALVAARLCVRLVARLGLLSAEKSKWVVRLLAAMPAALESGDPDALGFRKEVRALDRRDVTESCWAAAALANASFGVAAALGLPGAVHLSAPEWAWEFCEGILFWLQGEGYAAAREVFTSLLEG